MAKEAIEVQDGGVISYTLPEDVSVGDVLVIGAIIGVAVNTGLEGEVIQVETEKCWEFAAKSSDVIGVGEVVYFDEVAREMTLTSTNNTRAGKTISSKGGTAGTIIVKLNV